MRHSISLHPYPFATAAETDGWLRGHSTLCLTSARWRRSFVDIGLFCARARARAAEPAIVARLQRIAPAVSAHHAQSKGT